MNLAVRLYNQAPSNPLGIPSAWPESIVSLGDSTDLPDNTYQLMTVDELSAYKVAHQAEYDAWYLNYLKTLPSNIPQAQPVTVVSQPDPLPFAQPLFRTKRSAVNDVVQVEKGQSVDIDYVLTEERYVTGGDIIIENAEIGDYIVAAVEDPNGIIPAPYRATLCEAHPIVVKYIEKAFVMVQNPGSITPGGVTTHTIDTYPLNAKITPGLALCITYYAVNAGLTRRIAINYHLTKKL